MIKDKWKQFSIGWFFCNELSGEDAVKLFDLLSESTCDTTIDHVIDKSEAILWVQFENMDRYDLQGHILNLAEHAQEVENQDEN